MGRARKPGLARSELAKEAAKKSPVLDKNKETNVEKDLVNILEDLTISPKPQKESVLETKLTPSVPVVILDLVAYYEMLSRIPSSAHPSVRDFISSTFAKLSPSSSSSSIGAELALFSANPTTPTRHIGSATTNT